ncbi:MAG: hypothetical protein WBC18_26580 [Ottowia sp.]|uniref:hypothetical protein n=1 Tax=unclassified Ottowia TaxID=2645081 RepID=UPI003C2E7688
MDHTDVGLRAAMRALTDVVAPVVGAEHAQARDQLRLTVDYLAFVVERLPYLHQRERFELSHHLAMAHDLHADLGANPSRQLKAAIDAGETVLKLGDPGTSTVRQATAALSAAVSAVLRDSTRLEESVRSKIEHHVLHASKKRIAFERSWYQPLGLDPDPHEVRPLAEFLPASH